MSLTTTHRQDKIFVLDFLTRLEKTHNSQLHSMHSQIQLLNLQKDQLCRQLESLQLICTQLQKETQILRAQILEANLTNISIKTEALQRDIYIKQAGFDLLRTIPAKLPELMAIIQSNEEYSKNSKFQGAISFLAYSRDGKAIERFTGVNQKFLEGFLKAKISLISTLILDCHS